MAGSKDRRTGMNPLLVALGHAAFETTIVKQGHKPAFTDELDKKGLVQCPACGKAYTPDFPYNNPEAKAFQQEQHISGICSDACWTRLLG